MLAVAGGVTVVVDSPGYRSNVVDSFGPVQERQILCEIVIIQFCVINYLVLCQAFNSLWDYEP